MSRRMVMTYTAGKDRRFIIEIRPGRDGTPHGVSVTRWEGGHQQGAAIEIPMGKAPRMTTFIDSVVKALNAPCQPSSRPSSRGLEPIKRRAADRRVLRGDPGVDR